jgi:hypothetical protein
LSYFALCSQLLFSSIFRVSVRALWLDVQGTARGIVQLALSGPERVFDIAIISKIPVTFSRVMFAPAILATVHELADYYRKEIAQLRLIARDAAITAELWIRSKHGTWRFFLVTPSALAEIDREGKRLESGQTVAYVAGIAPEEGGST